VSVTVTAPAPPPPPGPSDFTLTASPTSPTVLAHSVASSSITVTSQNGFSSTVNLSMNNAQCTLSPTRISNGSGNSQLSCTFPSASTVQVTITGTSGTLSHSVTVTILVQDYTITASPSHFKVSKNGSGTSQVTVTSLNGFSGTVTLTVTTSPSNGPTVTLSQSTITVPANGSSTSTLTFYAMKGSGSYNVALTATRGTLTHSLSNTCENWLNIA
jgi:hypothetical protein